MSEEIIKVLNDLGNRFGVAIDWSSQNILPYLKDLMARFISLQNAKAIIWMVISLLVILTSIILSIILYKWFKKNNFDTYDDECFICMLLWGGFFILSFIFIIVLIANIFGLFQNIYTPELTMLEYIKNISINN